MKNFIAYGFGLCYPFHGFRFIDLTIKEDFAFKKKLRKRF